MKVVLIDGDVSYPPSSGKRLRTLHLMQRLARRHPLTYIARATGCAAEERAATAYLRDHGIEPILVADPLPRKRGLGFYGRLAANLFSPTPYSVASHNSPRLREAVHAYAATHRVDLWQLEWTAFLAAVPPSSRAPRLVMAPNVDSLIWQRYYENERHPLKRLYIRQQWHKFQHFEKRVFVQADRVVTVSEEDANLAREQFGAERVEVVENGIDRGYFENVRSQGATGRILFLGSLDWRPNLDALRRLLDDIFPAVQSAEPSARLSIVGRQAPPWLVQRVAEQAGVELHTDVADVRPFLAQSAVMAVPLRIGGGSRLKILESLASGLPVVSTRVGAEGLSLRPGRDLVVAEDVADMAAALVHSLRHPEQARALAEEGRRVVLERYDWDVLADKLEQVWEDCVEGQRQKEGEPCVSST
jgi:glycosyltransferase involved in cell wall biosynthesis